MQPLPLRIEAVPGYTPAIGRLVAMLTYARGTTLKAVEGLSIEQLDYLHDAHSNSIGALLAHMVAVECSYQVLTFEGRLLTATEDAQWASALKLGPDGQRELRGQPLEVYLASLQRTRAITLASLATRNDAWLDQSVAVTPMINAHWAWFHVAEDEINHRGQIRWLRTRLGPNTSQRGVT